MHIVAHHCLRNQQAEEQRSAMSPFIILQYLLFPTALFLAKALWGVISTTHIKSDCLNHSWKNNFSTPITAKRVLLLQRDFWNENTEVEYDRGREAGVVQRVENARERVLFRLRVWVWNESPFDTGYYDYHSRVSYWNILRFLPMCWTKWKKLMAQLFE